MYGEKTHKNRFFPLKYIKLAKKKKKKKKKKMMMMMMMMMKMFLRKQQQSLMNSDLKKIQEIDSK